MTAQPESNQPASPDSSAALGDGPASASARPARREDAVAMGVINVAAWRDAYAGLVPASYLDAMDEATMQARWSERMTAPPDNVRAFVAEIDGEVRAYAAGGKYRIQQDAATEEETTRWGELYAIYTHPDHQGRGAGRAVHDALLASLTANGFTSAALWVLRDNLRTIRWYGNRGWQADGATSVWSGAGEPLAEIRFVRPLP